MVIMNFKAKFAALAVSLLLSACGGGGSASTVTEPVIKPTLSTLSYENRRTEYQYFAGTQLPSVNAGRTFDARTFFQYQDGTLGFIYHTLPDVGPWNGTIDQAVPGVLIIMKQTDTGAWVSNNSILDTASVPGCIHSRKIVAADFNKDGVVDFVVACHGWDAPPYPGERSRVVLSQPDGKYKMDYMSESSGFQHAVAAADLNGDGYPDLVAASLNSPEIFINDKTGHFVKTGTISSLRKYFHMELVDLTSDGHYDLVIGGHDWDDQARIVANRGDNNFNSSLLSQPQEILIPKINEAQVVVDFLYVKSVNSLYVLRTGGSYNSDPNFYKGVWLQKFNLSTNTSTVVYANPNYRNASGYVSWIRWIAEKDGYITGDFAGEPLRVKIE